MLLRNYQSHFIKGVMAFVLVLFVLISLPLSELRADEIPLHQAQVVREFPHDARAFTQGLVFDDGKLYEGTGQRGESTLRLVDLETGDLLKRRNLDRRFFGEGITIMADKIYQLSWQAQVGFVYDKESFTQVASFYLPGEGWGITHDGENLIVSDGTSYLRFLNPETLTEIKRVQVKDDLGTVNRINELEYINGEVWANIWYEDYIIRIDPETGAVNSRVDLRGLSANRRSVDDVLNGIAWDDENQRLFVTGKLWPNLYEIEVLE